MGRDKQTPCSAEGTRHTKEHDRATKVCEQLQLLFRHTFATIPRTLGVIPWVNERRSFVDVTVMGTCSVHEQMTINGLSV